MRRLVLHNSRFAEVLLEGDVEEARGGYVARGDVLVRVVSRRMSKEVFLREFYSSLFGSSESYEEALEEFGPGFVGDDLLPDLSKPSIRLYSKTLGEWKDPAFDISHSDDFYNDSGATGERDSPNIEPMRLASGDDTLGYVVSMSQLAAQIEERLRTSQVSWLPEIRFDVAIFLDFQQAQGEGTFFKILRERFGLSPAQVPLQAIPIDKAASRYRLIAGPSRGTPRFVLGPTASLQLEPDPMPMPPSCTSVLVNWPNPLPDDLWVFGAEGDMTRAFEALLHAESAFYRIDIVGAPAGDKPFEISHENQVAFDVVAMKLGPEGKMIPATEATITIEPSGEHDLWNMTVTGDGHQKHVHLAIDQARGSRAARNNSKEVLKAPDDYILRRVDAVHVSLTVNNLVLRKMVLVGITLPRWIPLDGSDAETHLRTNYATLLQGIQDAIAKYKREHGAPPRFGVFANHTFDKIEAGNFLFRYNPPPETSKRFFLTAGEGAVTNGEIADQWLNMLCGNDKPASRPREMTEASLVTRVVELHLAKKEPLTPGEVFGLGLEEAGGDIGGAMLICHNTLRALARGEDYAHTGLNKLDKSVFDKLFVTIRGGYRCTDGAAGMPKDDKCAQANFAGDHSGPWYHFFGTAYYEIYTATPEDKKPSDNRWAHAANKAEQWYREYWPESWQDPDPEKEYINCCGISAADVLLTENEWVGL